ncbi:MAG: M48 family metallopeptidase [Bacteroidota bacterium]
MTGSEYLWIITGIIIFGYVVGEILDWLNLSYSKKEVPPEANGIYDEEKYAQSQKYHSVTARFSFITSAFSTILTLMFLWLGGFGWLDGIISSYVGNEILLALAFFGILFLISDIINIPFQLYSVFVIEEKFGFNKTTIKTFFLDKVKGYMIGAILGGGILAVLIYLVMALESNFWLVFWVVIGLFMVFMNMFYTTLILPLFNKLSPLEEGSLREAIEQYSSKVGFPLTNIYVIDGSKRSSKANAFFSGLGKKKKVVLYDTLIENHSDEELVSIFAHEVGHYKKRHIQWGLILSLLQTGLMLFILSLMIFNNELSSALGAETMRIHLNLIAFGILYTPISMITGLFLNMLSRKNEFEADRYAVNTSNGNDLANALKKLSSDNLSNLLPHPAYVFMNYSHPPLLKRLEAIRGNI